MNRDLSYQMDALIVLLEARTPWWLRAVCRLYKRTIEKRIFS
jgi:hypothetical protein